MSGQASSPLGYGDPVTLRYHYLDGSPQAAFPMRTIEDRGEMVVAWLESSTPIMQWSTPSGGDPRDLPLAERFAGPLSTSPGCWRGPGVIRVIPLEEIYQVIFFFADDGSFRGWYVNLESEKDRHGPDLHTMDWHLDLWIAADGAWNWKDEDEAAAAVAGGHLRAEDLARAYATGNAIIDDLDAWVGRLEDWRDFRPPPAWAGSFPELSEGSATEV